MVLILIVIVQKPVPLLWYKYYKMVNEPIIATYLVSVLLLLVGKLAFINPTESNAFSERLWVNYYNTKKKYIHTRLRSKEILRLQNVKLFPGENRLPGTWSSDCLSVVYD